MPQRSNLFQKVVRILHETVAGEATVEESAPLVDSDTGEEREVDVLVTTIAAGHRIRIGVEATASSRKADGPWVEKQLQKHSALPTDKLVLVSEAGFYGPARKKAEVNGALPLAPEDVPSDFDGSEIVNKLGSIYPKAFSPDFLKVMATCETLDGAVRDFEPPPLVEVLDEGGEMVGSFRSLVASLFDHHCSRIPEAIDLANVAEDVTKVITMDLGGPFLYERKQDDGTSENKKLCLHPRFNGSSVGLWTIQRMMIEVKLWIKVGEIPLSHRKLSGISDGYSFGEGKVGDTLTTVVVNETKEGSKGRIMFETEDGSLEGEVKLMPAAPVRLTSRERPRLDSNQRPSD